MTLRRGLRWAITLSTLALWVQAAAVQAAEIKVLRAGAMKSIVTELAEAFRQETEHTIVVTTGTAGEIRQKMVRGEPADVVIVTDTVLEQLAGPGVIVADTRADIARTAVGVAVRQGTPLPDISTTEAFTQAVLATKSLVYNDPARGATSGIGPLPKELQKLTTYSAAVPALATTPEVARAFVAFLARPALKPKLAAAGLDYREWRA